MPQLLLFKMKLWSHFELVSRKIQIDLQVWNLIAQSGQIMHAARLLRPLRQQGLLVDKAKLALSTNTKDIISLIIQFNNIL